MILALVIVLVFVVVTGLVLAGVSVRVLREYERGVVFRLGRVTSQRGPGMIFLLPAIDRMVRVSLRTVTLQLDGERVGIDASFGEARQHRFGISAILGHHSLDLAVLGEGPQCLFGHGVDGVGCRQGLDIQRIRRLRILGSGASPKEPLGMRAGVENALPPGRGKQRAIRLVGTLRDGDA